MAHCVRCSREGCGTLEATPGVFLACSRCDAKSYCGAECQKLDACAGHSACTVEALQEAADAGPLTAQHFQQAAKLLQHHPAATHPIAQEPLHDYLTTNPATGTTLATLQVLRIALAHPPTDPLAPPPGLLPTNVLAAILHVTPYSAEGPLSVMSSAPMIDIILVDAIAAALNNLLAHPINATLPHQPAYANPPALQHSRAARLPHAWVSVLDAILQHHRLHAWFPAAFSNTTTRNHCTTGEDQVELAWATAGLRGQPAIPSLPGADAMLLLGHLAALRSVLGLPACDLLEAGHSSAWNGSTGSAKLAMLLQQEVVALPHAGMTELVSAVMIASQGAACHDILKRPDAMRALARPLEALAADPLVWQHKPYAHHCQGLATVLFDWVASLLGLEGLQQLAQQLARPTIAALDALLELGRDERESASAVVNSCLIMMTHLAYTAHGQSCMAAAGCVPRWLELAARWKAQPLVLEQLLLLLQVPFHPMASEYYFRKLHPQQRWAWCRLKGADSKRPPLLDKQMGSAVSMDAMALLLESIKDRNCMVLLMLLLVSIVQPSRDVGVCVQLSQPVMDALLAFCSPPAWPLPNPDRARNPDVDLYINSSTSYRHAPQILAMNVLGAMYCKAHQGSSCVMRPGRPLPVPKVMLELLVKWLEVVTSEDELHKLSPDGCERYRTIVRVSMLSVWHNLMRAGAISADFLRQHNMIELCFRFLPLAGSNDRMFFDAGEVLDALMQILMCDKSSGSASRMELITNVLVQGRNADCIIGFLERQGAAAREKGKWLSYLFTSGPIQAFFNLLAVNYVGSAVANRQNAQKLLQATVVWDMVKAGFDDLVMPPGSADTAVAFGLSAALTFLDTMLSCGGLQQQQAEVVVRHLGRATVERALKAPWVLPCLACGLHPAAWRAVFEQEEKAAARAAGPAALASGGCGLAAPAASGRSKTNQADHKVVAADASLGQASTSTAAAATRTTAAGAGGAGKVAGGGDGGRAGNNAAAVAAGPGQASTSTGAAAAARGKAQGGGDAGQGRAGVGGGVGTRECSVCQAQPEATFLCSRCEAVRYCSAACQRADWKHHKRVCKQLQAARSVAG